MQITFTVPMTRRDLAAAGFTPPEIDALEVLKAHYDRFRESCASNREYERLCFLKWRYEQDEIEETVA